MATYDSVDRLTSGRQRATYNPEKVWRSRDPQDMGSSNKARQRAAEARAAEESAQKRRQRIINFSIGGVLVLVVLAIVGGAFLTSQSNQQADKPNPDAAIPAGTIPTGQDYEYGVPKNEASGKPVLEIWEDFQCPACAQFEAIFGSTVSEIAEKDLARVIWRSTSFLDANFPGQNSQDDGILPRFRGLRNTTRRDLAVRVNLQDKTLLEISTCFRRTDFPWL